VVALLSVKVVALEGSHQKGALWARVDWYLISSLGRTGGVGVVELRLLLLLLLLLLLVSLEFHRLKLLLLLLSALAIIILGLLYTSILVRHSKYSSHNGLSNCMQRERGKTMLQSRVLTWRQLRHNNFVGRIRTRTRAHGGQDQGLEHRLLFHVRKHPWGWDHRRLKVEIRHHAPPVVGITCSMHAGVGVWAQVRVYVCVRGCIRKYGCVCRRVQRRMWNASQSEDACACVMMASAKDDGKATIRIPTT